jgi:hypothetical protein
MSQEESRIQSDLLSDTCTSEKNYMANCHIYLEKV